MTRQVSVVVRQHKLDQIDIGPALRTNVKLKNQIATQAARLDEGEIKSVYFGRKKTPVCLQTTYRLTMEWIAGEVMYRVRCVSVGGYESGNTYHPADDGGLEDAVQDLHDRAVAWISHIRAQAVRFPELNHIQEKELGVFGSRFSS